jgi:release factor glutamine methyltransferase
VNAVLRTVVDLGELAERLRAMGCVAAEDEACELVDSAGDPLELETFLTRRSRGEPLAWITGSVQFCGRRLHIEPGVYVPRFESQELAIRAADVLAAEGGRAVDLCTGSGAVAAVLMDAAPEATVVGVEVDLRAAACARLNDVPVIRADVGEALRPHAFDLVTAVAPYVPSDQLVYLPADVLRHEPRVALDGGGDGLDVLRRVVAAAARLLRVRGHLFVELGADQDRALAPALALAGFQVADTWRDDDGDLRGLAARLTGG